MLSGAAAAYDCRHRKAHISNAERSLLKRAHGQYAPTIQSQRMNDLPDRKSHGKARPAFELDELRSSRLGLFKNFPLNDRTEAGPLLQRKAGYRGARPDRHHAVAVLAEDECLDLSGRNTQAAGQVTAESRRVELRPEANDLLPGKTGSSHGQISQHVYRVADHHEIGIFLQPGRFDLI